LLFACHVYNSTCGGSMGGGRGADLDTAN
jgi:hypothetical protein